jgi:PAS domain S-box-containing protein
MAGTISDVSELAESNRHLLRTEAMARIGHWSIKLPGDVMNWSPEIYRIFGVDERDFTPSINALMSAFHRDDSAPIEKALQAGTAFNHDARVLQPGGAVRHVQVSGDGMHDPDGRIIGLFGVVQDTTRRVEQEEQLQIARKMEAFGQMAGGVAHDFNNLLAVIMGNLELLKETSLQSDLAEQLISDALRAVARGRDLTGSLLNFTHKAVLQPRRIDVTRELTGIKRIIEASLPADIRLVLQCDPAAQFIDADPAGPEACLISLIMNSRDAMPLGGRITLKSRSMTALAGDPRLYMPHNGRVLPPGSYITLTVTDEGHGIAMEDLKRVFEPFFTTKGVGKGSGLGLSRVSGFAQQSGGTVRVESVPGSGAEVSLVLPAS